MDRSSHPPMLPPKVIPLLVGAMLALALLSTIQVARDLPTLHGWREESSFSVEC